jgi:hypothetical protein
LQFELLGQIGQSVTMQAFVDNKTNFELDSSTNGKPGKAVSDVN